MEQSLRAELTATVTAELKAELTATVTEELKAELKTELRAGVEEELRSDLREALRGEVGKLSCADKSRYQRGAFLAQSFGMEGGSG